MMCSKGWGRIAGDTRTNRCNPWRSGSSHLWASGHAYCDGQRIDTWLIHSRSSGQEEPPSPRPAGTALHANSIPRSCQVPVMTAAVRSWLGGISTRGPRQQALRALRGLRSEEHTSELQSHSDLVCRLLLEKKKDTQVSEAM